MEDRTIDFEPDRPALAPPRAADEHPDTRPGVPKEAATGSAPGDAAARPPRQEGAEKHLRRARLDEPTPVVGTGQPPRGMSGTIRRAAYAIPETRARHWLLLMLGDRVDVLEDQLGSMIAAPAELLGMEAAAARARRNPGMAALAAAGGLAALLGLRSVRRMRRRRV